MRPRGREAEGARGREGARGASRREKENKKEESFSSTRGLGEGFGTRRGGRGGAELKCFVTIRFCCVTALPRSLGRRERRSARPWNCTSSASCQSTTVRHTQTRIPSAPSSVCKHETATYRVAMKRTICFRPPFTRVALIWRTVSPMQRPVTRDRDTMRDTGGTGPRL